MQKQTLKVEKLKYSGRSSKRSGRHKDVSDELLAPAGSALSPFHQAITSVLITQAYLQFYMDEMFREQKFQRWDYCRLQTNTDVQWHHIHSGKSLERRISNSLDRYLPDDPKKTCADPLRIMQICRHILRKRHFISRGTMCVGEAVMQASQSISISFHKQFSR
jgi:hypothetical protein